MTEKIKVTFLGTATSIGVPVIAVIAMFVHPATKKTKDSGLLFLFRLVKLQLL